jgi:hypothetical protein
MYKKLAKGNNRTIGKNSPNLVTLLKRKTLVVLFQHFCFFSCWKKAEAKLPSKTR